MYSLSTVTVWTNKKCFTAAQRRALVEKVNIQYASQLVERAEVGNTRKRVAAYTFIFKTLADAEHASRHLYGVNVEVNRLMKY